MPFMRELDLTTHLLRYLYFIPFLLKFLFSIFTKPKEPAVEDMVDYLGLKPITSNPELATTKDLSVTKLKAIAKKHKCTINDYLVAKISQTFAQYFEKRNIPINKVPIMIAQNMKGLPKSKKEFEFFNWYGDQIIQASLDSKSFSSTLASVKN